MEKYIDNLTDKELTEFIQAKSLIEFCHRFWYSLDDIENISEETENVIVELLWNNLFSVISPFQQVITHHDRINKIYKEDIWQYISEHDFECAKKYIEFEKTK